ncbi:hypothetical protein KPY62_10315 [Psychrobacter sp. TAE2020]|uniref:hypothetical protein n=1 Tax=Psychrobacter sp. TAE2020 TaxID=2846762 RepID=UPI001C105E22|nr:hypothetical protein [Psychrobacter sp. TAE2020]MBU5617477.1 hypothetical protein [Psychrobacter sp. TAE2020]
MTNILNNAWVVGIGGGILSGLFVAFVSRYIFSKRDNREYTQKVEAANREVIYALRPGISDGKIPIGEVLDALLNATSRRYKVSKDDIFKPKQIAEELIKEIMDSSFISSDTKQGYCETLTHLIVPSDEDTSKDGLYYELEIMQTDYRRRLNARMSYILGLTSTLIVIMLTIFNSSSLFNFNDFSPTHNIISKILLPTTSILISSILVITAIGSIYSKAYTKSKRES